MLLGVNLNYIETIAKDKPGSLRVIKRVKDKR